MFPRAARFDLEKSNDVPGPNSYDPSTPEAHYKRGAMFERDARFRSARSSLSNSLDSPSSPTCTCSSSMASGSKVQLDSRTISLEKEKVRLEQRASKAEAKLKELQAQSIDLAREKKQLQTDNRLLQQKLEKYQSKTQTPRQNEIQELKAQIQSIESGRSDERAEIERLTKRLAIAEMEKRAAQEQSDGLKKSLRSFEQEMKRSRSEIIDEKIERSKALKSLEDSQSTIFGLRERLKQMDQDQIKNTSRIAELEEDNDALLNEIESISQPADSDEECDEEDEEDEEEEFFSSDRQRSALIAVSLRLASENGLLKHTCSQNLIESNYSAIRIRRLEYALSKKDEEMQYLFETVNNLKSDIAFNESRQIADELVGLHSQYRNTQPNIEREEYLFDSVENYDENQQILREIDQQAITTIMNQQQIHLDWRQNIIDRLQSELKEVRLHEMEWQRTNSHNAELQARLEIMQRNMIDLEEAYESNLQQITEAQENEEHWKMQMDQLQYQVDLMQRRMQGVEISDDQIQQASVREQNLLNDRQELLDDLARASNYEAAYYSIRAEAQKLITKLNEYDIESNVFTNLNTALTSLKNSNQKILYLDRLRTQLDETKLQYRLMEQDRNRLHKQCRELQASLDNFEQREGQRETQKDEPTIKQQGPLEIEREKAQPIDEREAAKRAWQARPKTRNWRTTRQAEGSSRGTTLRERPSRSRLSSSIATSNNDAPPMPIYRPIFDDSNSSQIVTTNIETFMDGEEEISLASNGTTLIGENLVSDEIFEAPIKRKYLRAQKSNSSLNDANRASPVASLPSIDALAWELDKENLIATAQAAQKEYNANQNCSFAPSNMTKPAFLLNGELTIQDLTGS